MLFITWEKTRFLPMRKTLGLNFYEIQSRQWRKSLFLFAVLLIFYFVAFGIVSFPVLASLGFAFSGIFILSGSAFTKFLFLNALLALAIALFHFYDARKFGARFIRRHLGIQPPDPDDRYHIRFVNTLEEMRIASGLPKVMPSIYPTYAINSMALIEGDNTPSIIVTEGLLAEFTRDEIQAVIAHEMAHIIRGDTFYMTLVCSLANFFERLRQASKPGKPSIALPMQAQEGGGGHPLISMALTVSTAVMHLLSTLISRQREILADAAAVELNRNPKALARAIYKAHHKNSFVGDFNLTYTPLFIVHPESKDIGDDLPSRLFNSHPPLMRRIRLLAQMVPTTPAKIIEEVWEIQKSREKARAVVESEEESQRGMRKIAISSHGDKAQKEGNVWMIRDPEGKWQGPLALEELLAVRYFTPMMWIRNIQEEIDAPAKDFPQIRNAFRRMFDKKCVNPAKYNRCPRCHVPLKEGFYEGVIFKTCPQCRGKLIGAAGVDRVVARKEITFSDSLQEKARKFRKKFMENPFLTSKINPSSAHKASLFCPHCGTKMLLRPFSYHYIIPVEKCLSCYKIWFDADELEILQILIENRSAPSNSRNS